MQDMPYFMENEEWYFFNGEKYELTENAPDKAKESYREFYRKEEEMLNA